MPLKRTIFLTYHQFKNCYEQAKISSPAHRAEGAAGVGAAPSLALAREANQNIFRIQLKRKNHPPKFKTIMKKNLLVWAAGYASGQAAGRDLIISLEHGSSFVQYLQPI